MMSYEKWISIEILAWMPSVLSVDHFRLDTFGWDTIHSYSFYIVDTPIHIFDTFTINTFDNSAYIDLYNILKILHFNNFDLLWNIKLKSSIINLIYEWNSLDNKSN